MDFGFTPENEAFRQEVREFLAEHVTPELRAELDDQQEGRAGPLAQEFRRKLGERGWIGMSWPREYGGQECDRVDQFIFEEEMIRAKVGLSLGGLEQAAAIMTAGTEEQKQYFLPGLVSGEVSFALGYTEPSGGTDLASLQTRAEEDGDYFVINGQKMFTSAAHNCSHIYLMARTDPEMPKHRGISIFLVPIETPGITVTPLWTIVGGRTNMVYLDDVRVPRTALLGEKNRGWYIASAALNLGRGGAGRYYENVEEFESIVEYVKEARRNGHSLAEEPALQERLAELYCEAQVCRLFLWRQMSLERRGEFNPPYEVSSSKVFGPEFYVKSSQIITQILGPYGQLEKGSEVAPKDGWYARKYLGAARTTFAHGGVQVMRNQIANRGLGLPRGS
jgi:3-oxocholest-4-en-26-oyl-CoA dehydrogenase alpha subunit